MGKEGKYDLKLAQMPEVTDNEEDDDEEESQSGERIYICVCACVNNASIVYNTDSTV